MTYPYYNDKTIKFEYNPQINKIAFKKNHVGTTSGDELELANYTYTDSNTIFLSNLIGNDSTGDGTQATPYKTVLKAINECTATKTRVVCLDYYIYAEDISGYSNAFFSGIYSALPADRLYSKYHNISRIATSANGLHIAVKGLNNNKFIVAWADNDDTNQGKFIICDNVNSIQTPLKEFGSVPATNLQVDILSNGNILFVYDGYFCIYDDDGNIVKSQTMVNNFANTQYCSGAAFINGGFLIAYRDTADSNYGNFAIYDNNGTVVISETHFRSAQTEYIQCVGLANNTIAIAFRDEDDSDIGKFCIVSYTGSVGSETTFNNASTILYYGALSLLSNDNFLIAYRDDTSNDCYFIAYDENGSPAISATSVDANNSQYICSAGMTDRFAILYCDNTDNDNNIVIYDNDGNLLQSKYQIESNQCTYNNISVLTNGDLIYSYNDTGDTTHCRWNIYTINELPKHSHRILGYTPSDSNSIFVSSEDTLTGDDTWAGTQKEPNLTIAGAIANVDATHQAVVILDSETYTEQGQEMTGNFLGLYAAIGQSHYWSVIQTPNNSNYSDVSYLKALETKLDDNNLYMKCDTFSDGGFVVVYADADTNTAKFVILDKDGTIDVSETSFYTTNAVNDIQVSVLSNDYFVATCRDSVTSGTYFSIWDQEGNNIVASASISAAAHTGFAARVCALQNGYWVGAWYDITDGDCVFVIKNSAGVDVKAETVFEMNIVSLIRIDVLNNYNFVIVYYDSTDGDFNYIIYDEDGDSVKVKTQIYNGIVHSVDICGLKNGNFAVVYNQGVGGAGYINIYDEDGDAVLAATQFEAGTTQNGRSACTGLLNDCVFIVFSDGGAGNVGKYCIVDQAGNLDVSPTQFEAGQTDYQDCICAYDGRVFVVYQDDDDGDDAKYFIQYPYSFYGLKVSAAATINGIDIDLQDDYLGRYGVLVNSAKPSIKWCNFKNITNPTTATKTGYAIYGDNETDVYNSIIADNDAGIYLGSAVNSAIIQDNLFYRNTAGYAVTIDGTAASSGDITVEHNTFFQNYGGINGDNWNGTNEIIKNNILHDNDVYGIDIDTAFTAIYNLCTDSNHANVTLTNGSTRNPRFINEGDITPADINLNLKYVLLDYPADSPAYGLADDNRDAGAWDIAIVGSITTWSTFTVEKPGVINKHKEPVGEVLNISQDGTPNSDVEGWVEYLQLVYKGLRLADYEYFLAMMTCGDSQVRIYPDPVTYSAAYYNYKIVYKNLNEGAGYFRLAEVGYKDNTFTFVRKYE